MKKLAYGTRVRILSRQNYYYGKIGYINDDNSLDIWAAQQLPARAIIPEYQYNIDIPTLDGNDIEHTSAAPHEIRVIRSKKK
jgi:hypothetical protein